MVYLRSLAVVILSLSLVGITLADDDFETLFGLDISELAKIEYTVASSKPETLSLTPAIVSRLNIDEMRAIGLRSLKDILGFVPGFTLQDAKLGGTTVMIRGVTEAFNQKVLFLLDDVPYWMPSHAAIPLLGIPITAIDSIEVIRGPGAVIYGTNATAGVIKVVTKQNDQNIGRISFGDHNRVNSALYGHKDLSEYGRIDISAQTQVDDGYRAQHINAGLPPYPMSYTPPTTGHINRSEEFSSFLMNYRLDGFHLGLQRYHSETQGIAGFGSLANLSTLEEHGYLVTLDNTWKLNRASIKVFSDFNNYYLNLPLDNHPIEGSNAVFSFDDNGKNNNRIRSGVSVDLELSDQASVFSGVETEKRQVGDYQIVSASTGNVMANLFSQDDTRENSIFSQLDWHTDEWRFLVGARYTDNDKSGKQTTPRISALRRLDENSSIKLMYSEGFNSPNFSQQLVFINKAIVGHEDLKAETIKSTDIAYTYTNSKSLFVANVYYFTADDFITRVPIPGDGSHFMNADSFYRYGLELDFQTQLRQAKLFSNFSYHHQGNELDDEDITALFAPNVNINIGLIYYVTGDERYGGAFSYTSQRASSNPLKVLNLNYERDFHDVTFNVTIRNVFDEQMLHPDIQDYRSIHQVPSKDGRNLELGVELKF